MNNVSSSKTKTTPSPDLPPLPQSKKETVNRLTKAAIQGIKELNVDQSGNTIVHDAVHLQDYRLFKTIFKDGCPYINTPNKAGDTPLHEAAAAGNYKLVYQLLKSGADPSVNLPDNRGMTPLHAAVASGNIKLVKLLLAHGAEQSANIPTEKVLTTTAQSSSFFSESVTTTIIEKTTPLHTAIAQKNEKMALLLLRSQAKESILIKGKSDLTPWQRAIIGGQISVVKKMLELNPELASQLNKPDSHGITDLQRAARNGQEMMSLLLPHFIENEIMVSPDTFSPTGEVEDCQTSGDFEKLANIPLEKFSFPLTIAQNTCNTIIALNDGHILKLRNVDAIEVRDHLMQKKYGSEWKSDQGANILTFYVSPGHGFMRLVCINCDDGKPYNMNRGFYPKGGEKLAYHQSSQTETAPKRPPQQLALAPTAAFEETTTIEDEEGPITSVHEANMIFTITPNIEMVTLNTTTAKEPITMSRNALDRMMQILLDPDTTPEQMAQQTYETLVQDASDGNESIPDFEAVKESISELHDRQITFNILAEWVQTNVQVETESGEVKTLTASEAEDIALQLLQPSSATSPAPIIENFLEQMANLGFPSLGLTTGMNSELLSEILSGAPSPEGIMKFFGKVGSDGVATASLTATEAARIAKMATMGTLGAGVGLASLTIDTVKVTPRYAKAILKTTMPYIPGGESLYKSLGANKRWLAHTIRESTATFRDQVGSIGNEDWYENDSDTRNSLKIMFILDDKQAKSALETIKDVTLSCKENPEKSCRYHLTGHNCMDFLQDVFASTGAVGDFVDYFTDEQLDYGHLHSPSKIFEFKGVDYGFIRSRGMPHYLRAGMYQKLSHVYNSFASTIGLEESTMQDFSLPHKFVHIDQLMPPPAPPPFIVEEPTSTPPPSEEAKTETPEVKPETPFPLSSYPVSIVDNINLARTVTKMAANLFSSAGYVVNRSVGKKVNSEEVVQVVETWSTEIKDSLKNLNDLELWINYEHNNVNEEIESLTDRLEESQPNQADVPALLKQLQDLKLRKAHIIRTSDKQIDLVFKGMELKRQVKMLGKSHSLPTKHFVEKLEQDLSDFTKEALNFAIEFEKIYPKPYDFISD